MYKKIDLMYLIKEGFIKTTDHPITTDFIAAKGWLDYMFIG